MSVLPRAERESGLQLTSVNVLAVPRREGTWVKRTSRTQITRSETKRIPASRRNHRPKSVLGARHVVSSVAFGDFPCVWVRVCMGGKKVQLPSEWS